MIAALRISACRWLLIINEARVGICQRRRQFACRLRAKVSFFFVKILPQASQSCKLSPCSASRLKMEQLKEATVGNLWVPSNSIWHVVWCCRILSSRKCPAISPRREKLKRGRHMDFSRSNRWLSGWTALLHDEWRIESESRGGRPGLCVPILAAREAGDRRSHFSSCPL